MINSLPHLQQRQQSLSTTSSSSLSSSLSPSLSSSSSSCGHLVTHIKGFIKSNDDILLFYKNTISHCKYSILQHDKIRYDFLRNLDNHNEFLLIEVSKDHDKDSSSRSSISSSSSSSSSIHKYNNNDELITYDDRVWSDEVDHMLETTKESIKYRTIYPQKVIEYS
jgi:hypothetical protein